MNESGASLNGKGNIQDWKHCKENIGEEVTEWNSKGNYCSEEENVDYIQEWI